MSIHNHRRGSTNISLSSNMDLNIPLLEPPMTSNENPPQLALSDIMHHMSPSPGPAEDSRTAEDSEARGLHSNGSRREREGTPEPLTEADAMAMRRRLQALGLLLDRDQSELSIGGHAHDFGSATSRERELVNMILRLTDPLPVDSTQLERQAEVISVLTSQRDLLVHQAEEDRERWRSEREGWDRMAEALLSHRNKTGKSATREDETERQKVQLESENRALRDKLQNTQNRLSSLESELMRLKPLLLMQPYSVAHLRQRLAPQPHASSLPLNTTLTTGHGTPVRSNKSISDVKGKRREADLVGSRGHLETIPEDLRTNEERGLGPSSSAQFSQPGSFTPSAKVSLFSGANNSTTDIYRWPEPPPQYSYPYNYNYSTPSVSPSKSTPIPTKITIDSLSPSSTGHSQLQNHTTTESASKSLGSTVLQIYPTTSSQSNPVAQTTPTISPQRRRSRDYVIHPTGAIPSALIRRSKITSLTSDARTEHVLLAARRIGRERAELVAGIMQHAEREKETHAQELEFMKARQDLERSEKERLERLANGTSGLAYYRSTDVLTSPQQRSTGRGSVSAGVPRTPKKGGGVGATHYPGLSSALNDGPVSNVPTPARPSTFVFVNSSAAAETSEYSGGGVMSTPGQRGSTLKGAGTAGGGLRNSPSNPPTPLDSLLDAARMMDAGAGAGGKAGGKTNGTRKPLEHPESPAPKRRRVSSGGFKTVGRGGGVAGASTGGKVTRVRSALDVLADQAAAAFDGPSQTRRGSKSGGKGKEKKKVGDESLDSGSDERVDDDQEGDHVDRQDDFWTRGSTSASASVSPLDPSQRAKTASNSTRPRAEPTPNSMSLRPVRRASQKRLASQGLQPPPSNSTTAKGKDKSRGRPKGSKSRPRSVKSSKMNPSLGPRVIVSAPTYSPLDEAIALQPQKDRRREKEKEHERSEEHSQRTAVNSDSMGSPRLSLRPVDWGERGAEDDEGDEDGEGEVVEADNDKLATPNEVENVVQDAETQINDTGLADVDLMVTPSVDDEADEDAEGEQEEEDEEDDNADAEAGQDRSSRSRTPPPPDPPYSGASPDDDPDADADAEGEMEFEESEEFAPTSTSSAVRQTALSDVWVFWMISHVLIPAMITESVPSSLSMLSSL